MADLKESPLGTRHPTARCAWCQQGLAIGEAGGLRCWACPGCWVRQERWALWVEQKGQRRCASVPLPTQVPIYESEAKHILWGGQAGPGKSYGARRWLYRRRLTIPGSQALLLRENWDQLETTHLRKMEHEVPALGGRFYKSDRKAVFGKGSEESTIDCGHMAETDAIGRYLSTEYLDIVPDEASLFPVDSDGTTPLAELSTRARQVCWDRDGKKARPRFLPVTNPGGPSAAWLADMFIHHTPDFEKYPALRKKYKPDDWLYIPARLDDNPYLDEEYEATLSVLTKVRYEQLRHGDWTVFSGQFFSEWLPSVHVAECVVTR